MANRPLNMQKIKQILLFLERGFSQRSIERETGINRRIFYLHTWDSPFFYHNYDKI